MNIQIAEKLKNLRASKGLSQEQVADYLHVAQSTYARMEKGESNSWANYIQPICDLFEIQPEELLKQESIIVNQNQQGGNGAFIINQLSEQIMALYEENMRLKDAVIADLRQRLSKYE